MVDDGDIDLISGPELPPHVYIHIPFCRSKCSYCDFASVAEADEQLVAATAEAILNDIRRWGASALPGMVETVYLGGGTPTHVADSAVRVLRQVARHFRVREGAEITVEANPESLSASVAEELRGAGATRLSLGVQSFDDRVLRLLGRPHDAAEATRAADIAARSGMDLSIDLMCGVPGQTMSSWQDTLDRALRTGATHVSVYPLSLEEGTPLAVAVDSGLVDASDPDVAADMMVLAEDVLTAAGLARYEVANYARPGFESRHNTAYWTGRQYLGIGPAAHGMLDAITASAVGLLGPTDAVTAEVRVPDVGAPPDPAPPDPAPTGGANATDARRVRYHESTDIEEWLFGAGEEIEVLSAEEARREDVMLGMRLSAGVLASTVERAGVRGVLEGLARDGLVELVAAYDSLTAQARWRTTRKGWLLGNEVFGRIWSANGR